MDDVIDESPAACEGLRAKEAAWVRPPVRPAHGDQSAKFAAIEDVLRAHARWCVPDRERHREPRRAREQETAVGSGGSERLLQQYGTPCGSSSGNQLRIVHVL